LLRLVIRCALPGALAERRARNARAAPVLSESDDGRHYTLTLGGAWHDAALAELRAALARATEKCRQIRVELLADCSLDSAALGLLLLLYGHQSKVGAALTVRAHGAAMRRAMHLQNVDFLLEGLTGDRAWIG
jgi:N-acetylglucosaminyldiphosphoundecaprenol N-acetyl-beta-D-mannosaminyltransferase